MSASIRWSLAAVIALLALSGCPFEVEEPWEEGEPPAADVGVLDVIQGGAAEPGICERFDQASDPGTDVRFTMAGWFPLTPCVDDQLRVRLESAGTGDPADLGLTDFVLCFSNGSFPAVPAFAEEYEPEYDWSGSDEPISLVTFRVPYGSEGGDARLLFAVQPPEDFRILVD